MGVTILNKAKQETTQFQLFVENLQLESELSLSLLTYIGLIEKTCKRMYVCNNVCET